MNIRSSLILGIIIASIASIVTVIIILIPSTYKEDFVSIYGCSTTLDIDKPSDIRWPEGLYVGGRPLPIKVYYCYVDGFADIRFVTSNNFDNFKFNEYEFVMRPGSTATITFLLDVSELEAKDHTGKVYTGVKAMMSPSLAFRLSSESEPEGFYFYPSVVEILSNEYVLVTYTAVADKDIIKRTTVGTRLGLNVYPILIFDRHNAFYISIIRD